MARRCGAASERHIRDAASRPKRRVLFRDILRAGIRASRCAAETGRFHGGDAGGTGSTDGPGNYPAGFIGEHSRRLFRTG